MKNITDAKSIIPQEYIEMNQMAVQKAGFSYVLPSQETLEEVAMVGKAAIQMKTDMEPIAKEFEEVDVTAEGKANKEGYEAIEIILDGKNELAVAKIADINRDGTTRFYVKILSSGADPKVSHRICEITLLNNKATLTGLEIEYYKKDLPDFNIVYNIRYHGDNQIKSKIIYRFDKSCFKEIRYDLSQGALGKLAFIISDSEVCVRFLYKNPNDVSETADLEFHQDYCLVRFINKSYTLTEKYTFFLLNKMIVQMEYGKEGKLLESDYEHLYTGGIKDYVKMDGPGKIENLSTGKVLYEGQFKDNHFRSGITRRNNTILEAEFDNKSRPTGWGVLTFPASNTRKELLYIEGKPIRGKALKTLKAILDQKLFIPEGYLSKHDTASKEHVYEYNGEVNESTQSEGHGTAVLRGGYEYTGQFKGNQFDGKGQLKIEGGETFNGTFLKDQIVHGRIEYIDGNHYIGDIHRLKPHGLGEMHHQSDGRVEKGRFENGKYLGPDDGQDGNNNGGGGGRNMEEGTAENIARFSGQFIPKAPVIFNSLARAALFRKNIKLASVSLFYTHSYIVCRLQPALNTSLIHRFLKLL